MCLPNLFVPGAAKSGTSSLHDYLGQHPDVFMSKTKEPHFFSKDANFCGDHEIRLEAYKQLFADANGFKVRRESSTGYMVFPHVVERIWKIVPDPCFIFLLRNPIDRAYSHYWWLRGQGFETRSFREAVLADIQEKPDPLNPVKGFGGYRYYFHFGQYGTYLSQFIDKFDRDSVFLVTTEKLRNDKTETVNSCFDFLGLSRIKTEFSKNLNETVIYNRPWLYRFINTFGSRSVLKGIMRDVLPGSVFNGIRTYRRNIVRKANNVMKIESSYPAMEESDRLWLRDLYGEEITRLRHITQLPFTEWGSDFG